MEKNTLLAIVLSVTVLFGYETIFVAPKRAQALKAAQEARLNPAVASKASTASEKATPSATSNQNTEKPTKMVSDADLTQLSSTKSDIYFTNVGGSLHKAQVAPRKQVLPVIDLLDIEGFEDKKFNVTVVSGSEIAYSYRDSKLEIRKSYEMLNNGLTKVRMEIKNLSESSILNNFAFKAIGIDSGRMDISNTRETMLDEYSYHNGKKVIRKGNAFKFEPKESKSEFAAVRWVAFREHYNAVIVKPEFETKSIDIKTVTEKKLNIFLTPKEDNIAAGQTAIFDFSLYIGEQDIKAIAKLDKGIENVVAFSSFAPIEWVAQAIYHTIPYIQGIIKSWGISIILISLIIYGMTYPLTIKSMMSMRKMQEVQPKLLALRERYKGDPQKLNAETMEIYKREKINPLGGCLPFILQMPFFMAIYQVLWRASYFQGKGFLWIKDLSQADKLFVLPFTIPFLGSDFNILPFLMGIVMFFQQKISAKSMVVADETQAMQQKMMLYFFPVFIAIIFYKFASSLSLYFTIFYLLSALTQYKMLKMPIKK